jgi:hypothetical protein
MGWKIINGHRCYCRSVREGGEVRSEYFGRGERAAVFAQTDELARMERAVEREERRQEREQADAEEREVREWFDRIEDFARVALLAAGFHNHKGPWRRARRHVGSRLERGTGDEPDRAATPER